MRYLYLILWLLLGLFYWYLSKSCCDINIIGSQSTESSIDASVNDQKEVASIDSVATGFTGITRLQTISDLPLKFKWSEDKAVLGDGWEKYKDSILSSMTDNRVLEITGLYHDTEENNSKFKNLGLARANFIAEALGLDKDLYERKTSSVKNLTLDASEEYAAFEINSLLKTKNVKEETIEDEFGNMSMRTTIYFPFNSTNKLNNEEVERYLDDVAKRIRTSAEKVQLVGHTDDVGNNKGNIEMGQLRANVIKDYLIGKGVNPHQILTTSKGESSPIATNETEEGRAKNRRTELTIIK